MRNILASGFKPENLNFCPECGAYFFPHEERLLDGLLFCHECGLMCYIIEYEASHREGAEDIGDLSDRTGDESAF